MKGSVGAACEVSPNLSPETMMSFFQLFFHCLAAGLGTIGDSLYEQLLHHPKCKMIHYLNLVQV